VQADNTELQPMNKPSIIRACIFFALSFINIGFANQPSIQVAETNSRRPLRVAVVGFIGDSRPTLEPLLAESLAKDERLVLLDKAQIKPALSAFGYDGSMNLNLEDAKHLGASIGCDFFIIGKTDSATRSERAAETHEERFIGIMMIDARSGALALFDFILKKAAKREAAERDAAQALSQQVKSYIEKLLAFRAARELPVASNSEIVEDLPDTESAAGASFKPPEFLNRVKPEFTEIADRADINATVEARVVFHANGEVGEIEIIRWAGFGLEEAATRAIRQLKFKPAMRNGQPLSTRATIRYNFRRVNER
jgi:TonB family protein